MVERINELRSELQPEPFRKLEVLVQAHIQVGEMRRAQGSELRRTITKSADCRIGEVVVVCEPLNTHSRNRRICDAGDAVAICTRSSRESPGVVLGSIDGQGETGAERKEGTNLPSANDGIDYLVRITLVTSTVSVTWPTFIATSTRAI